MTVRRSPRPVLLRVAAVVRNSLLPRLWMLLSRSIKHHCAASAPLAASTTTAPVMCGCTEQKYAYVPGVVNVKENLSPVSSAFDLKSLLL